MELYKDSEIATNNLAVLKQKIIDKNTEMQKYKNSSEAWAEKATQFSDELTLKNDEISKLNNSLVASIDREKSLIEKNTNLEKIRSILEKKLEVLTTNKKFSLADIQKWLSKFSQWWDSFRSLSKR